MATQYLLNVLNKYAVDPARVMPVAERMYAPIANWAGAYLVQTMYSGSCAKGTGNSCSTDLDLFISLSPQTPNTLREIFESLYQAANVLGWNPRRQNVSIGVTVEGLSVDLVPGRQQAGYQNWHSLYHRRDDSWRQTNVSLHIERVWNSRRLNEIRLVKLWRHLAGLEFPSFLLELCVLEALRGRPYEQLADNFWCALGWLRDNFAAARIMDPANTANCISDDLTNAEKQAIVRAAGAARTQSFYTTIVW